MLILFFTESQTSVTTFGAVVTSAAELAKGFINWEGFFYTVQSPAMPSVKLSSSKWILTDLDSILPSHDLFVVFLCFPQLPSLLSVCEDPGWSIHQAVPAQGLWPSRALASCGAGGAGGSGLPQLSLAEAEPVLVPFYMGPVLPALLSQNKQGMSQGRLKAEGGHLQSQGHMFIWALHNIALCGCAQWAAASDAGCSWPPSDWLRQERRCRLMEAWSGSSRKSDWSILLSWLDFVSIINRGLGAETMLGIGRFGGEQNKRSSEGLVLPS